MNLQKNNNKITKNWKPLSEYLSNVNKLKWKKEKAKFKITTPPSPPPPHALYKTLFLTNYTDKYLLLWKKINVCVDRSNRIGQFKRNARNMILFLLLYNEMNEWMKNLFNLKLKSLFLFSTPIPLNRLNVFYTFDTLRSCCNQPIWNGWWGMDLSQV